ncbi:hypothetical protein [uncultured Microbacterium sp.]|uniref:hypothetical protein n=1 Tax=uncultured Microbacterium sp. TaxID=191216 RepID=UPI0025D46F53|nr:hypothetical protein [uncultured Microbacterium sp.]
MSQQDNGAQVDGTAKEESIDREMLEGWVEQEDGTFTQSHPHAEEIAALDAHINHHPANKVFGRVRDLGRVLKAWHMYSRMLTELLEAIETSDEVAMELVRNVGDTSGREQIVLTLDQGIVAYVAGLGAVIDHARLLAKDRSKALQDRYAERTKQMMVDLPHAMFLAKLRNYILHNVAAPWEFSGKFVPNGFAEVQVSLGTETLLENGSWWNPESRAFITGNGPKIHLVPLLEPYRLALIEHIELLMQEVYAEIDPELDKLRALGRQRNLLLTGGVSDGSDWEDLKNHIAENAAREGRGEPALNFQTKKPFTEEELAQSRGAFGQRLDSDERSGTPGD